MDALAKKVMSKHGLSLEAARKHRAKQMPQRVVDPTSRLGFRRAEQGETESCEPYPLALGSLADVFLSLDSFGLGVSLYFRQLAWIFCVVFVCAMILCPSTTHNASACHHGDDVTTKPAYANTGLARGTASGCVVGDLSVGLNVAPDVVVVVVILLAALTSTFLQSTFSKRIEGNLQTPSDYSVVVANPPAHVLDPDRYRDFFAKIFGDDVVCVTVSKDNGRVLQLLARRKGYLQDLADFAEGGWDELDELDGLGAKFQPLLYGLGLLKTPAFARARLAAVEDELRVALAAGDGRKTVAAGDDWHKPKRVVVTFATEASMERTLQTFEVSAARRVFSNVTGIESSETPVDFEGTVLLVSRPVEPTEILWHNSHYAGAERLLRVAASFAATAGIGGVLYAIADAFARAEATDFLFVWVTFVNAALPTTLKQVTKLLERHREFGDEQDSMFLKLTMARWFNTAVVVFVTTRRPARLGKANLESVFNILFADAFVTPLIVAFDPFDLVMRYVVAPRQPTQRAMNRFWNGAEWNIAERYTDVAKTLLVGLFWASAAPAGLLVTAAALFNVFLVDRFCLLRRWARKPDFDDQLSRRSVGVLSLIVLVHTRAAMEFFMNWGLRFDDFGAQSGRPVDHQKHVKCFGTFFDCDAGDEDLTAAQRTVNRVYPALSVIAFIVAVWNLVGTRAGVRKHVSCDFDDFKVYLVLNPRV